MKCPYCNFEEDKVIDSRQIDEGTTIRRRRECLNCSRRFTTYEKIETIPIMVIKKDKSRQPFSREKILNANESFRKKTVIYYRPRRYS